MFADVGEPTIEFKNIAPQDAGVYRCVAKDESFATLGSASVALVVVGAGDPTGKMSRTFCSLRCLSHRIYLKINVSLFQKCSE